jgi:hypothetical protein
MKAEVRLFLRGPQGAERGPFRWTVVRDAVALGFLSNADGVRRSDEARWTPVAQRPELLTLPPGYEEDPAFATLRRHARARTPIGPRAAAYLGRLDCPIPLGRLNPRTALHWVRLLEELEPTRADATERWAAEEEAQGRVPAATPAHATAEQIALLQSRGEVVPPGLTRNEARRRISGPPTEEQLERLRFYGVPLPEGACAEEAAELVSRHMRDNFHAEEQFQASRRRLPSGTTPGGDAAKAAGAPTYRLRTSPEAELRTLPLPPPAPSPLAAAPTGGGASTSRRRLPLGLVVLGATLLAAALIFGLRQWLHRSSGPKGKGGTAVSDSATTAPRAAVVLQTSDPAQGERLRQRVAALELKGIVAGDEPRVAIGDRLLRVGDALDAGRSLVVVAIDPAGRTVTFSDVTGSIVRRGTD